MRDDLSQVSIDAVSYPSGAAAMFLKQNDCHFPVKSHPENERGFLQYLNN